MPVNFRTMPVPHQPNRPIEPIELFRSLLVRDPEINDLWLVQGDALRQWHDARDKSDVAIVINTGAGKTLIGLLAAQSLVNETRGHVLYACGSIQLVEQTEDKARGYGLDVTTYVQSQYSNTLYQSGDAPCITTYQALFNGKSRFFRERPDAIVFDDAHVAEHIIRDQFSLRISRDQGEQMPTPLEGLLQLFRGYFERVGLASYSDTVEGRDITRLWFVPPFALREQMAEVRRILSEFPLAETRDTMFAWEHLRDHLDLCALFVSHREAVFTPAVLPTATLPYFTNGTRRLYLSATLMAREAFSKTFGVVPNRIIAPRTTAGECERLVLFPSQAKGCGDDVQAAKVIIRDLKTLVLVPSEHRARSWADVIRPRENETVTNLVSGFKSAPAPAKLLLAARYDGIDLPGDTCRVMVIDDLPSGVGPLEKFLWEKLGAVRSLQSTVASRVVQSFGRISRGMSDYGVLIITGRRLVEWLISEKNKRELPTFLQQQINLGIEVSRQAVEPADFSDVVRQCLSRHPDWLRYYQEYMAQSSQIVHAGSDDPKAPLPSYIEAETEFGRHLWTRDYVSAAKSLETDVNSPETGRRNTSAWHALWLGYCYELMGDREGASVLYEKAHRLQRNIPPYRLEPDVYVAAESVPSQVLRVVEMLRKGAGLRRDAVDLFSTGVSAVVSGGSPAQIERDLETLGRYLGLEATRPEKTNGTGPDVLWEAEEDALCLELKTDKGRGSCYDKDDLGQLRDHVQWTLDNVEVHRVLPAFVGPLLPSSRHANPGPDILLIDPSAFKDLVGRVRAALQDTLTTAVPATLARVTEETYRQRKLLWPTVFDEMPKTRLVDVSVPGCHGRARSDPGSPEWI